MCFFCLLESKQSMALICTPTILYWQLTDCFFFFLPHNSVVISMLRNKTWNHVCVILYWFHSIWGCCFIIGWMDCPSCPWPVSCKVFCFVLKILLRLQKHNCFLPIQYLQYSVIQCICSEYLTKMSKTLTVVLDY